MPGHPDPVAVLITLGGVVDGVYKGSFLDTDQGGVMLAPTSDEAV
jgi:hypothetical protein